jgi:uncharacterized protein YkwD
MSSYLRALRSAVVTGPRLVATGVIAALVAGAVFVGTKDEVSDPVPTTVGRNSRCWDYKRSERSFARKMNSVRRRKGRRGLRLDPELSKVARVHTTDMVQRNTLYHTSSSSLRRRVVGWTTLGENVGVGNTVRSLHKAFMHSRYHRANILYRRFRFGGVGVKKKRGRMWVTVVFEARNNPGTRLRMPRC